MRPVVIGIGGKIGAGKDVIARHLQVHYNFQVIRFADDLKEEVLRIMRRTLVEIWKIYHTGSVFDASMFLGEPTEVDLRRMVWDEKPPIIRRMLQEWGTELRRNEDPDYWIKLWSAKVKKCLDSGISVAAPDTRFKNELEAVKAFNGFFVRTIRPGSQGGDHASETELDHVEADHTFYNTKGLPFLHSQVDGYIGSPYFKSTITV